MYYLNNGYTEWSLDINSFNKEFITKCTNI